MACACSPTDAGCGCEGGGETLAGVGGIDTSGAAETEVVTTVEAEGSSGTDELFALEGGREEVSAEADGELTTSSTTEGEVGGSAESMIVTDVSTSTDEGPTRPPRPPRIREDDGQRVPPRVRSERMSATDELAGPEEIIETDDDSVVGPSGHLTAPNLGAWLARRVEPGTPVALSPIGTFPLDTGHANAIVSGVLRLRAENPRHYRSLLVPGSNGEKLSGANVYLYANGKIVLDRVDPIPDESGPPDSPSRF